MRSLVRHEDSEIRPPVKQEGLDVRSLLRPSHRHRPSTAPSLLRNLEMAPEDPSDVTGDVTMERRQRLPVDLELGREEAQHQKYFSLAPHKRDHKAGGHTRRHAGHHGHVSLGNVFRESGEEDLVSGTLRTRLTDAVFRRKERQRIDLNADIFFSSPPADPSTVTGGEQQQQQQQQGEEGGGEADTVAPSARQISK